MDGIELLIEVKKKSLWLPVLEVTGNDDVSMAVNALRAGAADFIEKLLDRDTSLEAVRGLLRRNSAQTSLFNCCLTKTEVHVLRFILEGQEQRRDGYPVASFAANRCSAPQPSDAEDACHEYCRTAPPGGGHRFVGHKRVSAGGQRHLTV
jgi:DNA-binding response OmpR family regulator